jgi:hypothetical protein
MECLHHAVIGIQGHDDRIISIPARDDGNITIAHYLIDHSLELVSSIRKINDSHPQTLLVQYIVQV